MTANYSTQFRCIRDEVSPEEWETRLNLAACYRLTDVYGMTDLIYNHITARIPGDDDHLLINLYGLLYKEITASSLVKIDLEGNILWKPDTDYGINKSGYVIHGAMHRARPEVKCVMHTHTRAGMAVSSMKCGLLPMTQTSMRFVGHHGYHDYEGPAIDLAERERLVRDLGPHDTLILRNPGLLTCGRSIREAFDLMYYLQRACEAQVVAQSTGAELIHGTPEVAEHVARQFEKPDRPSAQRDWQAHLRVLDRVAPAYKAQNYLQSYYTELASRRGNHARRISGMEEVKFAEALQRTLPWVVKSL